MPPVPRFVPTLTEVVPDLPVAAAVPAIATARPAAGAPSAAFPPHAAGGGDDGTSDWREEQLVHRVLQRVDGALGARLSDAVRTVVQDQTRELLLHLREEIADAVRITVAEALAEELVQRGPDAAGR